MKFQRQVACNTSTFFNGCAFAVVSSQSHSYDSIDLKYVGIAKLKTFFTLL